jgi:competence protein ComEA
MRHRAEHEAGHENVPPDGSEQAVTFDSLESARSTRVRIGIGAAVIILIAAMAIGVVVSAVASQGTATEVDSPRPIPSPAASGFEAADTTSPGAGLLVHVLGAVKRPGLVSLGAGTRVVDAVAAAGGLTDDAEPAGINLARPVSDGEQLVVPRVGEVLPPSAAGTATGGAGGAGGSGAGAGVVDLNSATQEQLESLQGIGPALASRILDWREANGRFANVADLMNVTGIGQKVFDGLKDRIRV